MLGEGISEAIVRHPDKAVSIGGELWRLRMWLVAIKDLSNRLALVWSQRRHIHQRHHSFAVHRSDDSTRISMTGQNHWPRRARQGALHCGSVIFQGG